MNEPKPAADESKSEPEIRGGDRPEDFIPDWVKDLQQADGEFSGHLMPEDDAVYEDDE